MSRGKSGTRVAGGVSLLAAMMTAAALTGAAFFTVSQVGCDDPGNYARHDDHIELVGGCVDPAELRGAKPAPDPDAPSFGTAPENYQP